MIFRIETFSKPDFPDPHGRQIKSDIEQLGIRSVAVVQSIRVFLLEGELDPPQLQRIAREANGRYFRASGDGKAVESLAAELDGLQKANVESEFETRHVERFQGFLLVALLALVVIELIPDRVTGWLRIRGRIKRTT